MNDTRVPPARWTLERREVLALGVGAFVAAWVPWARAPSRRLFRRRVPLMGTMAEIAVVHHDPRRAGAAADAAFDALRRTDRLMSRFRPDSDIGRANLDALRQPVRIDAETAFVLKRALDWARDSQGRFDPCLGRVSHLWDVKRRARPPANEHVRALAGRDLWQALDLDLDARGGAVRYRDPDVSIDLGGIAKGYGVDQAAAALRAHGIRDGLVNVGGDLYALGRSADGDPWTVGVRSAHDPARVVRTLTLEDSAVATSGDYQQYFEHGGQRYHHLFDPATGAPVRSVRHSVTRTAATCLEADAAATASFAVSRLNSPPA